MSGLSSTTPECRGSTDVSLLGCTNFAAAHLEALPQHLNCKGHVLQGLVLAWQFVGDVGRWFAFSRKASGFRLGTSMSLGLYVSVWCQCKCRGHEKALGSRILLLLYKKILAKTIKITFEFSAFFRSMCF